VWSYEPKIDGWRLEVVNNEGHIRLVSRRGCGGKDLSHHQEEDCMPTYMLTESDRLLVAQALRERGLHLREAVAPIITPPLPDRQREQCVRQADQAEMLATLVEQSVRVDIWPMDHELRRDPGLGWQRQLMRAST
jgi:hypothetical protein